MKSTLFAALLIALFLFFPGAGAAPAQSLFGTLTNFDVFNDTGQETCGFEIELHGVSRSDVSFLFGGAFNRYGDPRVDDFPGGVYVHYRSGWDSARGVCTAATPVPPAITPTAGHSCWTGGAPGYDKSGCEHFGVGLIRNPTEAHYRWLVADPSSPGTLRPFSREVNIAMPLWTVSPAPAGGEPIVKAVIEPPKAPLGRFGDAVWVKVYESESAERVDLHHLLTDDPAVPHNESETEIEWELMQADPKKPERSLLESGRQLGKGKESVVRRYEFYKFTGFYDAEHEARCGGDGKCGAPLPGELGDYIGAQMAAAHIGAAPVASMDLALSAGGASAASTIGSPGGLQVGYAGISLKSGAPNYGTAVFSFRQHGVVASEAAVPASVPTTAARIFVDYGFAVPAVPGQPANGNVDVNTGVAVVNGSSGTAKVTYTLRSMSGDTLAVGHGTVAPGVHFAKFINEMNNLAPDFSLPGDFAKNNRFGTLEISSDQSLSVLALRLTLNQRGEALLTSTPTADLTKVSTNAPLYFPQFVDGGGYTTTIVLLNTSAAVQTGRLLVSADDGSPLAVSQAGGIRDSVVNYSMQPGGAFVFQSDGSPARASAGFVRVIPDQNTSAPEGAGVFRFSQQGIVVTESGIASATPTTHARIYVDKSGGHDTGVAIVSPNNFPSSVDLKIFGPDGSTQVGNPAAVSLTGNGHTARFVGELIAGLPADFTGVLDISSASPFAALTLRSLSNSRGDFLLTTFPTADLTRPAPSAAVFPQIADGDGYVTQFILLSAGAASNLTLSFHSEGGLPLSVGR